MGRNCGEFQRKSAVSAWVEVVLARLLSSPCHSVSPLGWAVQGEAVDLGVPLDARCLPDPGQVPILKPEVVSSILSKQ